MRPLIEDFISIQRLKTPLWGHESELILMNRLNETESAVFKFCRFPLFLKDVFTIFYNILCYYFSLFCGSYLVLTSTKTDGFMSGSTQRLTNRDSVLFCSVFKIPGDRASHGLVSHPIDWGELGIQLRTLGYKVSCLFTTSWQLSSASIHLTRNSLLCIRIWVLITYE